jgi:DNA-binding LacI/PurR family transcriptional regulator
MAKVTTNDIALAAGVSQSTVSFVLNNISSISISRTTRERVLKKAEELGYRTKKRHREKFEKPITIGVLVPTLSNVYYPSLLQNIELYANEKGISCIIINTLRSEEIEEYYTYVRQHTVDGLLCLYTPKMKIPEDIPAVLIGEKDGDQTVDTISLNSVTAGRIIAHHLVELGHTKVAFLSSPLNRITPARRNRLKGIRDVLSERGLEKNLRVVIDQDEMEAIDNAYEYTQGRKMTEELLMNRGGITAIVAVNDMTAIGVIAMLNEKGVRIPDDISVAGFDNILLSTIIQPQLTTVDQMAFHGSKLGLDVLLEKIRGRNQDDKTINVEYEPHLIIRGSTGRLR